MLTKDKVIEILEELSGKEEIHASDRLQEDLAFDSLAMVTILLEIEDAFAVTLEETDMDPFLLITVEDVIALAERYQMAKKQESGHDCRSEAQENETVE